MVGKIGRCEGRGDRMVVVRWEMRWQEVGERWEIVGLISGWDWGEISLPFSPHVGGGRSLT